MDAQFELFMEAIISGSTELFGRYFKAEYLEREDTKGWRSIHHACYQGHSEVIKLLITHNCDIETHDEDDQRPIHLACYQRHSEAVKLLIEHNCDIEALDGWKQRPIHHACYQGHSEAVKLLIEHNCDIEALDGWNWRPIHIACYHGHSEAIKLLIEHNCDIEALNGWNRRPIHLACDQGHSEAVKLLIENKCDIEALDIWNQRPIHLACYHGNSEAIKLLIEHKCDIEALDWQKQRPIHLACYQGRSEAVKLLIDHKCDIEALDWLNQRPIHLACDQGYSEAVKLLIDHKCNIEALDGNGDSPLALAEKTGNKGIICILNGARLLLACKDGNVEKVSSLLSDTTIEYYDKDKRRPIHWACESGNIEIVKLLIKTNCDITVRDKSNSSPFDIAVKNDNKELVEIVKCAILDQQQKHELEQQISTMRLTCESGCDHKLCPESLRTKSFDKGSRVGMGSFGEVFKLRGSGIDTDFAIKRIQLEGIDAKYIEGNIHKFLPKLNNIRIVKYFGAIKTKKHLCLFMEYFPQGSLETKILSEKSIATDNVIRYSKQILEGLEFLHGNKIIHRDIKPANILMDQLNNIKLADFGVARSLMRTTGLSTRAKTFVGTVNFTSPEVLNADDDSPYTVSSDIWSVGATVINMISGKAPLHDCLPPKVIIKISSEKKLELPESQLMSAEMKSFIEEMLNPDPDQRPTAAQLLKLKLFS